jgi:tRNA threonylcarbamoyl adenosine modification protein YjeE
MITLFNPKRQGKKPELTLELELADEAATEAIGRILGALLKPGEVVLLIGRLGAGKTTFSRGLARGLGVDEAYAIVSPTFTLLNIYPGRVGFFHADLYRLDAEGVAELELLEEAAGGVLAVEWPERAGDLWPAGALRVELAPAGKNARRASLTGPAYVLNRLRRSMNQ